MPKVLRLLTLITLIMAISSTVSAQDTATISSSIEEDTPSGRWSLDAGYRSLPFASEQNLVMLGLGFKPAYTQELNLSALLSSPNNKASGQTLSWRWYFSDREKGHLRLFFEAGYNLLRSSDWNTRDLSAALGGFWRLERNFGLAVSAGLAGIDRALPLIDSSQLSTLYSSRLNVFGTWIF